MDKTTEPLGDGSPAPTVQSFSYPHNKLFTVYLEQECKEISVGNSCHISSLLFFCGKMDKCSVLAV